MRLAPSRPLEALTVAQRRPFAVLVLTSAVLVATSGTARADVVFTRGVITGAADVSSVAVGDLDERGGPDLVSIEANAITVRLNKGDGTFGEPTAFPTSAAPANCSPYQVQLADVAGGDSNLAGDGHLDAVVACFNGILARLPGTGTGAFGSYLGSHIGTAGSPYNAEDRFALAEWRESGPPVAITPQAGNGYQKFCWSYNWDHYDCPQVAGSSATSADAVSRGPIVAGEADGGDFDEVLTLGPGGVLRTFGIDTGSVSAPRDQPFGKLPTGAGNPFYSISIGDLQPDGIPDVITTTASTTDASVNVILGETLPPPGPPSRLGLSFTPFASLPGLVRGAIFDADDDGRPDFVGALNSGRVIVHRSNGAGGLSPAELVSPSGYGSVLNDGNVPIAKGDLDRNGTTDLVVGNPGASSIQVFLNHPGNVAPSPTPTPTPPPVTGPGPGPGPTPVPGAGVPTPVPGGSVPTPAPGAPQTGSAPPVTKLVISGLRTKGRTVSVEVNLPATVAFNVQRCKTKTVKGKKTSVCKTVVKLKGSATKAGRVAAKMPDKVTQGNYLVTATAPGAATVKATLVVPKR